MQQAPLLSIAVITYNRADLLQTCLASLAQHLPTLPADISYEIVVMDNASQDESEAQTKKNFPQVKYVKNPRNGGYAYAVNTAFRATRAPFVLLLNNDCVLQESSIAPLFAALQSRPDLAVAGGLTIDGEGKVSPTRRRFPQLHHAFFNRTSLFTKLFPDNRWSTRYLMTDLPLNIDCDVDWLSGGYMLLRRTAYEAVQGWDEGFFLYIDDVDFCLRLNRLGWKTRYVASAQIVHKTNASRKRFRYATAQARSMWRFYRKHLHRHFFIAPMVAFGIALRLVLVVIRNR